MYYNEDMPDLPEKEVLNKIFGDEEKFPVTQQEMEPSIDKEIEPLVEKLEKEIYLSKPVTDDSGAPLVSASSPQQPTIVLPVTKTAYFYGLTQKVTESIRWLTEWCLRLVKIFGERISFREPVEQKT